MGKKGFDNLFVLLVDYDLVVDVYYKLVFVG